MVHLVCSAASGEPVDPSLKKNEMASRDFHQETGKKSSFLLDTKELLTIPQPAHLIIDHQETTESIVRLFYLGGFQIVSNAKQYEVYLTNKDDKETYLTSSKGIPFEKGKTDQEWFKAVCVIPGGPRPTLRLRIKFLSLKPADEAVAKIYSMKVTARIPESTDAATPSGSKASPPAPSMPTTMSTASIMEQMMSGMPPSAPMMSQSDHSTAASSPGLTQSDLGAAMASMSILARGTESGIEEAMSQKFQKLEEHFDAKWGRFERHVMSLTSVVVSQKNTLDEQLRLVDQQHTMMKSQSEQMCLLLEQQQSLMQTVKELQTDMSTMRDESKKENGKNLSSEVAKPRPATITDDLEERGIEHTLSNLEMAKEDDDDDSDEEDNSETIQSNKQRDEYSSNPQTMDESRVAQGDADLMAAVEKIEVSLLKNGESEQIQEHVHEEMAKQQPRATVENSSTTVVPTGRNGGGLQITRSFEDRNDKNETKEPEAPDKIDIELLAGEIDENVEVIEETNADEHERSPPEVKEGNLLDL